MHTTISEQLFERASQVIPGGVNSPVRAFKSVNRTPLYVERGTGSTIIDADGNTYIDFVGSWGPLILGHAHPDITRTIAEAATRGTSFGACHRGEIALAETIAAMVPCIEKVRLVNSGTEATMSAVRLARGYTGRNKIIKFEGCYHGHADAFLVKAGSGVLTLGIAGSPGVPPEAIANTLVSDFNNIASVEALIAAHKNEIAAIIIEPVMANAGLILPEPGFLEALRAVCTTHGIVLIFDEVITGFRLTGGGAQGYFAVTPDLVCLGKIIGGGLPVGAFGGKAEIMDQLAPLGPVYQAGTLSGNPLAVAAGQAMLDHLRQPDFYNLLHAKADKLESLLRNTIAKTAIPVQLNRIGSMFCLFFTAEPVTNYLTAIAADGSVYARFFNKMLEKGFYLPPSQYETWFIGEAHTEQQLLQFCAAVEEVLGVMCAEGIPT